jgi:sn-1 stearoyl-lipid 9-desaturase
VTTTADFQEKGKLKVSTLVVIVAFHLTAILLAPITFSWANLQVAFWLYVLTGLGITVGYHRLFTHGSYKVTNPILRAFIAFAGTLALQGSVIDWVVDHFRHHNYSDQPGDPHTTNEGFWWAHILWLFYEYKEDAQQDKLRAKLNEDKVLAFIDRKEVFIGAQFALGFLLLLIGGWGMVTWGVFVRVVFTWHVTWCINSACHIWGYTEYEKSGDKSKNLWWMAILANGEGWHNNHHMYQASPRHGLKWWQIDLSWYLIWTFSKLGWAEINPKLIPVVNK